MLPNRQTTETLTSQIVIGSRASVPRAGLETPTIPQPKRLQLVPHFTDCLGRKPPIPRITYINARRTFRCILRIEQQAAQVV